MIEWIEDTVVTLVTLASEDQSSKPKPSGEEPADSELTLVFKSMYLKYSLYSYPAQLPVNEYKRVFLFATLA